MRCTRILVLACLIALCGMCAISGASALASNDTFTAEKYPYKVKSTATNDQGFKASVATSVCTKGTFTEVGDSTVASNELVVHPLYEECSAGLSGVKYPVKVETTGCNYRFFDTGNDVNVECESGKEIHVNLEGAAACKINVPSQSGLKTVTYNDTNNASGTNVVDVEANVKEIEFNSNCSGVIGGKTAEYREGRFGAIVPELGEGPAEAETEGVWENELKEPIPDGIFTRSSEPTYSANIAKYEVDGKEASLSEPIAVAVDPSNNIWVADRAVDRVVEYSPERKFVREFGSEGSGEGQFEGIGGIASNASGDIYVSDAGNHYVQEFSPAGKEIRKFGSLGIGEGQFIAPGAIAIDSSGDVWVLNSLGIRVQEFSPEGKYISGFGTFSSPFLAPTGLAFSGGHLYVSEASFGRVVELSTSGEVLKQFGSLIKPSGIATDPSTGNLYVTELGTNSLRYNESKKEFAYEHTNNRVQELSPEGSLIATFGSYGSGAGQFSSPRGLAVSAGTVYVADTGNKQVQEWVQAP